jgi:hypothetical protein
MEVHHHPDIHHRPKKWREYFLEFFMIFLAVTMGFIAENIRETISEHSKAREYAESLYKEVYGDSVIMQNKLQLRNRKEDEMEYFRSYVLDSSLTQLSLRFYPSFSWSFILTTSIIFEPNDGILNELKNSGSKRYLKSLSLQKDISDIDVVISKIRNRNNQEYSFVEDFTRPFTIQFYDFKWQDFLTQHGKLSFLDELMQNKGYSAASFSVKNLPDFKRDHAEAITAYYLLMLRATRQLYYEDYVKKNHQLLEALRNEYNIDEQ